MGHIKLAKAKGKFDVMSADNVLAVKLESDEITIFYAPGGSATIKSDDPLTDGDVFEITKAIDVMDGTSGPAPLTKLSVDITGIEAKA
jgi:hypothetical protein